MPDKVAVDFDVPMVLPVHLKLLSNLDALQQPQERGAVEFLKLGIIPDDNQPFVGGLLVLLRGLHLGGELQPLFSSLPRRSSS